MKKSMIILILLLCGSLCELSAQLSLGLKGGFNRAWEYYGDVDLPEDAEIHVSGLNVGVVAYWQLNRYLSIGMEPGYVERGAACVPGWMPIFEGDTKFFLNYVEAPVLAMVHLPLFKDRFELYAKAGYGPSVLVGAEQERTLFNGENPQVEREKIEIGDDGLLNRWDHGMYTGLGMAYKIGIGKAFVESNYFHGFKDADRFNTSKNRSLNLNVGYRFEL